MPVRAYTKRVLLDDPKVARGVLPAELCHYFRCEELCRTTVRPAAASLDGPGRGQRPHVVSKMGSHSIMWLVDGVYGSENRMPSVLQAASSRGDGKKPK